MQKPKMIRFTQAVRQVVMIMMMMSRVVMMKPLILEKSKMMKPLVLQLMLLLRMMKAGKQTLLMLGIFNFIISVHSIGALRMPAPEIP